MYIVKLLYSEFNNYLTSFVNRKKKKKKKI